MQRANTPDRLGEDTPVRAFARRFLFVVFLLLCAFCVTLFWLLQSRGNAHASLLYVVLLYVLALPALFFYWRANRVSQPVALRFGKLHLAIAVLFSLTAIVAGFYLQEGGISDESAYKFQARIFAEGKLKAAPMPGATANVLKTPPAILFEQTIQTPTGWFSKYPPGWPLILSVGYLLHCAWLVNPICGILQLFLIWLLARPWGRNTQILAVVIAASSGFMLAFSIGFMSHGAESVVTLLALWTLFKGLNEKRLGWITASFLLVVAATEIRPYTGAVLGLLCAFIVFYEWKRQRRLLLPALAVIVGSGILAVALFFLVNDIYTGSPLVTPYAMIMGGAKIHELTFNPLAIAVNILHVWRWSITDTLRVTFPFMFLLALYGCWKESDRKNELIYLALLFPLLVLAYFLQSEGSGGSANTGERFYFEGFAAIAIVAARGLCLLANNWRIQPQSIYPALAVLLALQVGQVVFTLDAMTAQKWPFITGYRAAHQNPPPLVFFELDAPPLAAKHANWNAADWQNARTIYLVDPGASRRDVVACRFHRPAYRVVESFANGTVKSFDRTANCVLIK